MAACRHDGRDRERNGARDIARTRPQSEAAGHRPGQDADANRRLCAVTRASRERDDLIRFVVAPDGVLVPDLAVKLPGRGVWVTADAQHVARAVKTKAFARSLKQPVTVADDLPARVDALMAKAALQGFSLANKAGEAVCGFDKTFAVIDRGDALALFHGRDASEGGRRKLDAKYRAVSAATGRTAKIIEEFTIDQLSLAMGRSNVVHAALTPGGAARRAIVLAGRLKRYRSGVEEAASPSETCDGAPP